MNPLIPPIHHQLHGYRSGHQLLNSSIRLDRRDQDLIDRLSDMAGPLRPGETFDPYLSCYPLPSEDFYVLSRTRQDTDAPRAGCVITQTILVPMDYWEKGANLPGLIEILESDLPEENPVTGGENKSNRLPAVKSGFLPELLEALFLERRAPIVVFAAEESEILTVRLLIALWPAMRRKFSVCTLSLAPRMLIGRPFDLLFAPKAARSRFSEWPGRRIDSSGKESHARHRWTDALVHRVFESQTPNLMSPEAERLLSGGTGDESALRLTLLWEELQEKAKQSPAAALGLLDIANSKQVLKEVWTTLEHSLLRAVDSTIETGSSESAWMFARDMAAKLVSLPPKLVDRVLDRIVLLAERDVHSALVSLNATGTDSLLSSPKLLRAIALHIEPGNVKDVAPELVSLAPIRLLQLLGFKPELISLLSSNLDLTTQTVIIDRLVKAVDVITVQARYAYLKIFSQYLREANQAPLLKGFLRESSPQVVAEVATIIWHDLQVPELGAVVCEAAMDSGAQESVREVFALGYRGIEDMKFILELTSYTESDVRWLLTYTAIQIFRADLLNTYIGNATVKQLEVSFAADSSAEVAIGYLMSSTKKHSKAIASLLSLSITDTKKAVHTAPKIYKFLSSADQERLLHKITNKLLSESEMIEELVPEFASSFPDDVTVDMLLSRGRGHSNRYLQLDELLSVLDGIERLNLHISEESLDFLVAWIVDKGDFDLSTGAANILGKILGSLRRENYFRYEETSLQLLPVLMNSVKASTSVVIVQTFPAVYEMLRREENGLKFSRIFSFADWDKCKAARKGLVRAFLRSCWPPADLAKVAYSARDTRRIFKDLVQEYKGYEYLQRIKLSSNELDSSCRREVLREIHRLEPGGLELV